ncbi:hypothetical protein EDF61_11021 [Arthrobacter sp. JUb115]|nr:hypothetical protein EDF61_11021 [Arthrobacter sp. JUb115]
MPRAFIYGSCVGGDTANVFPSEWDRPTYVARQSIISAAFGPTEVVGDIELTSAFQRSMLEGDIEATAFPRLRQELPMHDALILDIVDERLGVYELAPGEYLTRSMELISSKLIGKQPVMPRLIDFGSDEHWGLWSRSVDSLVDVVKDSGIPVFAVLPPWSKKSIQGADLAWHSVSVESMNNKYARYNEYLVQCDFTIVTVPDDEALGDAEHKWGLAPFHYTDSVYESLRDQILAGVSS